MTWHTIKPQPSICSQGLAGVFSLTCYLTTIRSERARSKTTQDESYSSGSETGSYQSSRYGTTCEPSTANNGEGRLTSYVEDSPARTLVQPEQTMMQMESSEDSMERSRAYGQRWLESLQRCDLDVSLSKTHLTSEQRDSPEYSATLMQWGIMLGGVSWGVKMRAQITTERECGYLPTPTCHNAKEGAYPAEYTRRTPTLAAQIGGKVNPLWNEWRMGWPIGWTDLKPLETGKIQLWLQTPSRFFRKP